MEYLKSYISRIRDRGNPELAASLEKTASEVGARHLDSFSWMDHITGLLFGNIQSGKTGQMFGIICEAADRGFPVFVLLTTDNVTLQQQTLNRARKDLPDFCICGENDSRIFMENQLEKPTIVILKKNYRMLELWSKILSNTGYMKGNPLMIIDDEADAASLNTMVNKNKKSSINRFISMMKDDAASSIYLQVTGTPQGIFLQSLESGFKPAFVHYFEPGQAYLGGDFFFPAGSRSENVELIDGMENPMRNFIARHLLTSAVLFENGRTVSNALMHPGVRKNAHEQMAVQAAQELEWAREHLDTEFRDLLEAMYEELQPVKNSLPEFQILSARIARMLQNGEIRILVMNGDSFTTEEDYGSGCSIISGGNTLGRGVTFPALNTFYYSRTSKNPQADTMWQHNRMFGYDRDPGLVRVYMDSQLCSLFTGINAVNNSLTAQVQKGCDSIRMIFPEGLNPTRKNIIDNKKVNLIPGGTNFFASNAVNRSTERLTDMLAPFEESQTYTQISLKLMLELLDQIEQADDFNVQAYKGVLKTILSENPLAQGILIVRRNRDISRGARALLSPDDWKLGSQFHDRPVLTMYQVTGNKGWEGHRVWVPNIKLPDQMVYYDITE